MAKAKRNNNKNSNKKRPAAKSSASGSSIKVNNKQQNRVNKSKHNSKIAQRIAKKSKNVDKNNNGLLDDKAGELFRYSDMIQVSNKNKKKNNGLVDDKQLDRELSDLAKSAPIKQKRRPQDSEDDDYNDDDDRYDKNDDNIESRYKVKAYIRQGLRENKLKKYALPIKTKEGALALIDTKQAEELMEDDDDDDDDEKEELPAPVAEEEKPKTVMEIIREKKQIFDKLKQKIAILSRDVLQDPQEELKKLKELRTMLTLPEVRVSYILRKLIVVSLGEIFRDILPGYKIRPLTEKEEQQTVSKEVQQLRDYEQTLLKQYKLYLDYLNDSIKGAHKSLSNKNNSSSSSTRLSNETEKKSIQSFVQICIRCLCNLLTRLSHFNFTNDIIQSIVNQMTSNIPDISTMTIQTIQNLFKEDKELKISLEVTQKIAKLIKQKSFGVKPDVLNTFLWLKLKEIPVVEDKKKKMTHKDKMKLSRNDRKKQKEKEQLEHELEEKSIADKLKAKANTQSRILEQVFMIYFNILKKNPNFKLIPCVLEGLAKFAHLISVDFFDDLVKVMHQLIESEQLTFRSKLHCIKTVFVVLSGQGEALSIDPLKFYTTFYNVLLRFDLIGELDNTILLADCIDMMFIRRKKQIPTARLLAFIKRLTNMTLNLDVASCAIIYNLIRKLTSLNKSSDLLFDNDYQYNGIYDPETVEPDYANAQNTALWELHLMRRHYNQLIAAESIEILKQAEINLIEVKKSPEEIAEEMNAFEMKFLNSKPEKRKTAATKKQQYQFKKRKFNFN